MKLYYFLLALVLGACELDAETKPVCVVDDDCGYHDHCVVNVCMANQQPIARDDVMFVVDGATRVEGDVLVNDRDPDGDALSITGISPGVQQIGGATLAITVPATLPEDEYSYEVGDGDYFPIDARARITLRRLEPTFELALGRDGTASFAALFARDGLAPEAYALVNGPAHGALEGTAPSVTYTPAAGFCGVDAATYQLTATNGTFDVEVQIAVGHLVPDISVTIPFDAPRTVDVVSGSGIAGLTITSVASPLATIADGGTALVVDPPHGTAASYTIRYTVEDAGGCVGWGTLLVTTEFPTDVVVGTGITGDSFDPAISNDGKLIAFTSADATLVPNDTNGAADVFVLDATTGLIERVSVGPNGEQANGPSGSPSISADGRVVAFSSQATNLAAADTTSVEDIYVRDRQAGTTVLASPSIDDTGSDQPSITPHLSADGHHVAFASSATRLVDGDTNNVVDIFARDLVAASTARVSVTSAGGQASQASRPRPRISGDGRYVTLGCGSALAGSGTSGVFVVDTVGGGVTYTANSWDWIDIDDTGRYVVRAATVVDRLIDVTTQLFSAGFDATPSISSDGQSVAIAVTDWGTSSNDGVVGAPSNGPASAVRLLSVDRQGTPVNIEVLRRPELSGDGRWVVFATRDWPAYVGRYVIVRAWAGD